MWLGLEGSFIRAIQFARSIQLIIKFWQSPGRHPPLNIPSSLSFLSFLSPSLSPRVDWLWTAHAFSALSTLCFNGDWWEETSIWVTNYQLHFLPDCIILIAKDTLLPDTETLDHNKANQYTTPMNLKSFQLNLLNPKHNSNLIAAAHNS